MKKLKANQIGPWCSFCPPKTVRATYRENGFADKFCCVECISKMEAYESSISENNNITEADRQTWMRV